MGRYEVKSKAFGCLEVEDKFQRLAQIGAIADNGFSTDEQSEAQDELAIETFQIGGGIACGCQLGIAWLFVETPCVGSG